MSIRTGLFCWAAAANVAAANGCHLICDLDAARRYGLGDCAKSTGAAVAVTALDTAAGGVASAGRAVCAVSVVVWSAVAVVDVFSVEGIGGVGVEPDCIAGLVGFKVSSDEVAEVSVAPSELPGVTGTGVVTARDLPSTLWFFFSTFSLHAASKTQPAISAAKQDVLLSVIG